MGREDDSLMRKPKVPFHFYSDLYYENFYFCSAWTRSEIRDYFKIELADNAKGVTLSTPNGIIIWVESKEMLSCLAHEAVHAAKFLFNQKGIIA